MVLFVTSSMIASSPGYGALRHFIHNSIVSLNFKVEIWIVLGKFGNISPITVIIGTSRSAHPSGGV